MKSIWTIAIMSLRLLTREKSTLIWMLIVPVIYIFIFGNVFSGRHDPMQVKADLSVLSLDQGELTGRLIQSLQSENLNVYQLDSIPENPHNRILIIPEGFSASMRKGKKDSLVFSKRADANAEAAMTAEMAIRKAAYRLIADMTELKVKQKSLERAELEKLDERMPLISIDSGYAGKHKIIPAGFSAQVPAQVVQFTLLILFIYVSGSLFEEKRLGLLRRIRVAPIGIMHIYLGKLLGAVFVGLWQIGILLAIGRFCFGVYLGQSWTALFLLAVTYATSIAAMSLILGFIIKNAEKLSGISIISALALSAFSGCWWPIEITPGWMQTAATFLPPGLALKTFHRIISYGDSFSQVIPYLLGQAGFAVLFSLLFGLILVRYTKNEQFV